MTIKVKITLVEELLAALKMNEGGFNHARCVVCAGWNMSPQGETDKVHTPTCPVGLAIKRAEMSR